MEESGGEGQGGNEGRNQMMGVGSFIVYTFWMRLVGPSLLLLSNSNDSDLFIYAPFYF